MKQTTQNLKYLFPIINQAVFDGELDKPEMKAINLIEMLGITVTTFGYKDKDGFAGLTVDLHNVQFVAVVKHHETFEDFVATFVHELIHVWQAQNGKAMNHKKEFKKMCKKASKKLGIKIT